MRGKIYISPATVDEIVNDDKYTFTIETDRAGIEEAEKHKDTECDITIEKHRDKRSLTANGYLWELCGKIADKLSDDGGAIFTKEDVYRNAVREVGAYNDIYINIGAVDAFRKVWQKRGIAWFCETVDGAGADMVQLRCYEGSSSYNSKQMSRIIDYIVQDCDALGIDHRTPNEINNLISLMEGEKCLMY